MIGKFSFFILSLLLFCGATQNSLDNKSDFILLNTTDSIEKGIQTNTPDEKEDIVRYSKEDDNILANAMNRRAESLSLDDKDEHSDDFHMESFEEKKTKPLIEDDKDSETVEILHRGSDTASAQSNIPLDVSDETQDKNNRKKKAESFESLKDDDKEAKTKSFSEKVTNADLEDKIKEEKDSTNVEVKTVNDDNEENVETKFVNDDKHFEMKTVNDDEHIEVNSELDFDQLTEVMNEKDKHRKGIGRGDFEPIPMPTSFESYDINNDQAIDKEELIKVTGAWKNVDIVFRVIDTNDDDKISRTEFYKAPLDLSGKTSEEEQS